MRIVRKNVLQLRPLRFRHSMFFRRFWRNSERLIRMSSSGFQKNDSCGVVEQVAGHMVDIGFTGTVLEKKALQIYAFLSG